MVPVQLWAMWHCDITGHLRECIQVSSSEPGLMSNDQPQEDLPDALETVPTTSTHL